MVVACMAYARNTTLTKQNITSGLYIVTLTITVGLRITVAIRYLVLTLKTTLQANDHRCSWSNFVYPQHLRTPWMRAKEVKDTLKITKTDLSAIVRTGEVEFTIIGQYFLFNHHEIIDYGIKLANEEVDLKEVRSKFYRLREQDKIKKI